MTEEERRIITAFIERVAGVAPVARPASPWGGSSVPATQSQPPLPPVDPEADRLLGELFARYPEARYRLAQTAFVQDHALVQAQNRIQELEWALENAQAQAQAQQSQRGGLFGGMFGGGRGAAPMRPRPMPMTPPGGGYGGYNPGMMQQGGSGFLGSALTTAAGVAGGMVMGNMLMNMFSGGGAAEAATHVADTAGGFAEQAVPTSSPWTDPGAGGSDAYAADSQGFDDAGYDDDNGGFDDEI